MDFIREESTENIDSLIYEIEDDIVTVIVLSAYSHYGDKQKPACSPTFADIV